ncbi:MAG: hypothetical protein KGI50_07510 [Patescibacteria group bacterium]|nr:hypothetical protein [Patescibacteria group bacterium]
MEALTGVLDNCNGTCPKCCSVTPALILAEGDKEAKNKALSQSTVLLALLLTAHVYIFLTKGKSLPIPDIVWAVVLGPWLGHGVSKLLDLFEAIKGGKP